MPATIPAADALPWFIVIPLLALIAVLVLPKRGPLIAIAALLGCIFTVSTLTSHLWQFGAQVHAAGGWTAPLGIVLYADGLTLCMLGVTAIVGVMVSVYAITGFRSPGATHFWPLWLLLLLGLNGLFLSRDLFNLYVCLEVIGLSAATLAAQKGSSEALAGAMRYMLTALLGSLLYLLGVVFLYHAYGTLSIDLLGAQMHDHVVTRAAFVLIAVGLLLKTALFPLHFWLPAAHSNASAAVSALLSALVIKASLYLLMRLWLDMFAPVVSAAGSIIAGCGAAAVLWGSIQALRQQRLKLLVAYSTVAQVGYLFLAFALNDTRAWQGVVYLAIAHALAKAAMFLAAGNIAQFSGHDRIGKFDNLAQRMPISVTAFAIAGVSLMGLPPSAGFIGKWLFLQGAIAEQQWALAAVMIGGGVLTAAYVFRVIGNSFTPCAEEQKNAGTPVAAHMQWAAMVLACCAIVLGFLAVPVLELLAIGEPLTLSGSTPAEGAQP